MAKRRIAILGGGFAGTAAARHLERRLPADWEVVLVSKENYTTYHPLLAETVGASILPSHVVAPLRQIVRHTQFRMVDVTDVDFAAREIHYLGEGDGVIHYDELVIACGVGANLAAVHGMANNALPLKTLGDALFVRNRLMVRLEHADICRNPETRRWLASFVVVGGGFSGVEVAAELHDFLAAALRYYPNIGPDEWQVTLLHGGPALLPELSAGLGEYTAEIMRKKGIDVRLGARVDAVDDRGVQLTDGTRLDGGTVICTIGTAPHPLVASLGLPLARGRLVVAPDLSVPGLPNVWAIGDCAAVPNAFDDSIAPPTAQFALREAHELAANLCRRIAGEPTRAFAYAPRGQLASIGRNRAVAELFGLKLHGFLAWLLWRGFYLLNMPTLARKVRLFLEWNWEMLFPPDIVHLRYARSRRETGASEVRHAG